MPAHAQATLRCPPNKETIESRVFTVIRPDVNRIWRSEQYNLTDGNLSKATLHYSFTLITDFVITNDDEPRTEFLVESIGTFIINKPEVRILDNPNPPIISDTVLYIPLERSGTTVTVTPGNVETVNGVEVSVSGSVDLLDPIFGIDPNVFLGDGILTINYDIERFSTVVRRQDRRQNGFPYNGRRVRISRDARGTADLRMEYECSL